MSEAGTALSESEAQALKSVAASLERIVELMEMFLESLGGDRLAVRVKDIE